MKNRKIRDSFAINLTRDLHSIGFTRRDFIKLCCAITASIGLPKGMSKVIAEVIEDSKRLPVIWLHFQECTGCTETLLRATHPTIENLILDLISLEYSETLSTPAGHNVEQVLHRSLKDNKNQFILIIEGSIPTKDNGIYCKIGGKTALDLITEIGGDAAAVIAIGSCASWGGVQSSEPNPTGAKPVHEILTDIPIVNIPGCPPNPYNLLSTVLYYLTLKKLPQLDSKGRPVFSYGSLIHENCKRRANYDAGRFVKQFGDQGHREGWCLYEVGCKGPETYANCPVIGFGTSCSWPVSTGHPCFGCTEKNVGFTKPIYERATLFTALPPDYYPAVAEEDKGGIAVSTAAILGGIVGAAAGAGYVAASRKTAKKQTKKTHEGDENESK